MMMTRTENRPAPRGRLPRWQRLLIGALTGGAFGFAMSKLVDTALPGGLDGVAALSASAVVSAGLAAIALMIGLIILIMSFSRKAYEAENWTPEMDAGEHRRIAPQLRLTAIALFAMAVEFGALAIPASAGMGPLVVVMVAVALLIQIAVNYIVWRDGDELYRAISLEGSAIGLGIVLILLSIWVPLVTQGMIAPDPLMLLIAATVASIVPTIWLAVRRGMTA